MNVPVKPPIKPPRPPTAPAINFPNQPQVGDVFLDRWRWDGQKWVSALGGTAQISIGSMPPLSATAGNLWWDDVDGVLYIFFDGFWVPTTCCGGGGGGTASLFTATSKGIVPASGGGTLNFLRADGRWMPVIQPSIFTAISSGLVPASGGGSLNFMRADGLWEPPFPNMPNNTILGNMSGGFGQVGPLDQDELRELIGTFPATQPGLVPEVHTGFDDDDVLTADGTWKSLADITVEIPDQRLMGNVSGASDKPEPLTAAQVTAFLNIFTQTLRGLVPPPGTATPTTDVLLADGSWSTIGLASLDDMPAQTVIGNSTTGTATPVNLSMTQLTTLINVFTATLKGLVPAPGAAAANTNNLLRGNGTWGSVDLTAMSAQANNTVVGNVSGAAAVPVALSAAQLTTIVNTFTSTLKGLVAAPGATLANTNNLLRGDGTWGNVALTAMAPIANNTVVGNVAGSTTTPVALTTTQLTTLINTFTTTLKGAVPAPGAAATVDQFLRYDGTWVLPRANFISRTADYAVLPTDDVVRWLNSGLTITMPDAATVTNGKTIQLNFMSSSGTATIALTSACSFMTPTGWVSAAAGTTFTISPGSWLFVKLSSPGWIAINQGRAAVLNFSDGTSIAAIGSTAGIGRITQRVFNSTTTYTPTAGTTYAMVECIGGGGAGGGYGASSTNTLGGGGGGSGGYTRAVVTAAQIGASQAITIGAGGTGVAGGNGGAGTATTFGSLCTANGGNGGIGSGSFGGGGAGGTAGSGTTGAWTVIGSLGGVGYAFSWNFGTNWVARGGSGGEMFGGNPLGPTVQNLGQGANGSNATANTGAGGSGAAGYGSSTNYTGGNGATGRCIVTEYGI